MPAPVFKIPCSLIHKIMGEPKKKGEKLSEGAKSFCENWAMNKIYDKSGFAFAWQSEKGLAVEQSALDYINEIYYPNNHLAKNEKCYENEYIIGTPDVINESTGQVIDIKCPWSHLSMPVMHEKVNNMEYYWQIQGYLDIINDAELHCGTLIYVLMDAPEYIVHAMAKKLHMEMNGKKNLEELIEEYREYLTYSNYSHDMRFHFQHTAKSKSDISAIHKKVIECRNYINPLLDDYTWDE